jgi:hypothetical protein
MTFGSCFSVVMVMNQTIPFSASRTPFKLLAGLEPV